MARRFNTWADLIMSGAEIKPHEVAFAVVKDGSTGEAITRRDFVDRALRVSRGFQELGLRKGSVAVLRGDPSISWAVTFAGILLAGGMPAPIHAQSKNAELARVIAASGAAFAVVSGDSLTSNLVDQDIYGKIITFERVGDTRPNVEAMFALEPAPPVICSDMDLAVVMQTSGTTGHPKCVAHTHASHLEFLDRWTELTMVETDKALSFLPLNHQSGLLLGWLSAYSLGIPYYQLSPFTLAGFWDAVRTYDIAWAAVIAPVPAYMIEAEPSADDRNHKLRFVAGSRRPSEMPELERRFGIRPVRPYGSTETTILAVSADLDRPAVKGLTLDELAACAGPAVRGWSFRIVGEDGSELPHSTTGELQVHGPSLFSCYLNDPEATAKAFTEDGWFRTGDRAYVNEHAELFFVERAGNSIRRNGESISAAEIEAALLDHPGVRDAAVVAVPDALRGQEVRACVVRQPGSSVTAEELFQHCMVSLAKFKVPRYIDFWPEFPLTSTLKISRSQLNSDPDRWVDRYQKA
jgi:crotonobetaine/carnitine-CoA ligase